MTNLQLAIDSDLFAEPFLRSLQNRIFNPLNEVTQTDFILEGGITIALRKTTETAIIKLVKYPLQTSIVLPFPNDRLIRQNGEATLREIFAGMINAHRQKRVRLVQEETMPDGLVDLIFDCISLGLWEPLSSSRSKISISTPSSLQRPGISISHYTGAAKQFEELRNAVAPLLALLPDEPLRLREVAGSLASFDWARGHDIALSPKSYDRAPSEGAANFNARTAMVHKIIAQISKFDIDPTPIITALGK